MTNIPDADNPLRPSEDSGTTPPDARDGTSLRETSLRERELAVEAREDVVRLRGRDGADHIAERERAVEAREKAVLSREEAARLREEAARAQESAVRAKSTLEQSMVKMREVNARLVEATLRAQRLAEKAEEANELKDEFLATVSHELRTPLNAVLGWARILAKKLVHGERAEHATVTIERNASLLAHMIDDLLDLSASSAGSFRLACQAVDVVAVTAAAIDSVEMLAEAKRVKLFLASAVQAREPVNADFGRLQQVIWNLLCNAIKFSPEGGRVDISVTRNGNFVEIVVADAGEGITPDFLPHVFDRFRQADSSTTRRHGGLGLGLSIARQIIEQHQGTIRAESGGPGTGATLTVSVPVLGPATLGERRTAPERTAGAPPLQRLDRLEILVVEDNADVRDLMSTILEHVGARVTTSVSVHDALHTLETLQPDVLVTDIGLPDQDGFALIREVRRREHERGGFLPAVALTGFTRAEDRVRALAAGFQGHLAKPVEPAELTAAIAALARAPRERK